MALNESNLVPAYHGRIQKIVERIDGVNPETGMTVEGANENLLKMFQHFQDAWQKDKMSDQAAQITIVGKRIIDDINHLPTDGFLRKDLKALDVAEAKVKEVITQVQTIMAEVRGEPTADAAETHTITPVGSGLYKGIEI